MSLQAPMAARPISRWFLWLSCVLVAFFCARRAEASAPMCDARGMSIDAPPPVMPIRDARIEGTSVPLCRDRAAVLGVGHQVRRGAAVVDGATLEGWIKTGSSFLPKRAAVRAPAIGDVGLAKARGHDTGVFRPPRMA